MEKRKTVLSCLVVVWISALLITPGDAQGLEDCDVIVNIGPLSEVGERRIPVNQTVGLCLQCFDNADNMLSGATWGVPGGSVTVGDDFPGVGENIDGTLVLNSGIPGSGRTGEFGTLFCFEGSTLNSDITIYSTMLVPPMVTSEVRTAEGIGAPVLNCENPNSPEVSMGVEWYGPGDTEPRQTRRQLIFVTPERDEAGEYECRVVSTAGETASSIGELIVEYAPEVTFNEPANVQRPLNGALSLTCDYSAVPMPTVQWFLNGTRLLNDSTDPRITVDLSADDSVLSVTGLRRDEGGNYSCSFVNVQGNDTGLVTTLLVLIPPAPVTNLTVLDEDETTVGLEWDIGFDGRSPITRARVTYFIQGQSSQSITVEGSTPTGAMLTGLMSFMTYNISVVLENDVGLSDSESVEAMTISLVLGAPNVTGVADSSTALTFNWTPPPDLSSTDPSSLWVIEFQRFDGLNFMAPNRSADILTISFDSLDKGTVYQARVRGENIRGPGLFSENVLVETAIDPPTMPQNVMVTAISSFALRVQWMPPSDDGGRPIQRYVITVNVDGTMLTRQAFSNVSYVTVRGMEDEVMLEENTTYPVGVAAENTAGRRGPPAQVMGTTLDITQPQPVLEPVEMEPPTNNSVVLTWPFPGGMVDEFILEVTTEMGAPFATHRVNGTDGMDVTFNLTGLEAGVTYRVVITTVNANGNSIPSEFARFTTRLPDRPVVTGPEGPVTVGDRVVLTCTTPDNYMIRWERRDGMPIEEEQDGITFTSTLTLEDVQIGTSAVYVCRVDQQTGNYTLEVLPTTTAEPTESTGISTTVIIIAACVGGVGLLLILFFGAVIICCCCCGKDSHKNQYTTTSKATKPLKTDKRTKELFEVSTNVSYGPVDHGGQRDTGVSFDMPEDFQAHSSFNTLDKPNRSSSPDAAAPTTSFGVAAPAAQPPPNDSDLRNSSPPRYQDMPPSYTDGTLL